MPATVVLLAVAATGYVAGAFVQDSLQQSNNSMAFAQPVRAAETNSGDAPLAAATLAAFSGADESTRSHTERIADPRECDLGKGISTACMFLD